MEAVPPEIERLPSETFAKGDLILAEGAPAAKLYFLMRGTVEVRKDGVPITRVRERGAVFGEMSVLLGSPHTAAVRAASEVECRVADNPAEFLLENPGVMYYVGQILARRLESLNRYLVDVKHQLRDQEGHLGMVDEVLGALMNRHPREVKLPQDVGD